jgi:signal transduction histidine kinase
VIARPTSVVAEERDVAPVHPGRTPVLGLIALLAVLWLSYVLVSDALARPAVLVACLLVFSVTNLGAALGLADALPVGDAVARQRVWDVGSTLVGIGALAPALVLGIDADVGLFAPVFAVVVLSTWFILPRWLHVWASWYTLVVWGVTLLWDGTATPAELVTHVAGAALVLVASSRLSAALTASRDAAASERAAAERRAALLAALGRTNQLDPERILASVTEGLLEAGFETVVVRTIDQEQQVARLVRAASVAVDELPDELPIRGSAYEAPATTGRLGVVGAHAGARTTTPRRRVVAVPVVEDGAVTVAVAADRHDGEITVGQLEAAQLLAEQAGQALERARAFAADGATVQALQALDRRSRDFVSTVSHELRTPLTVVRGLGQTLLSRWDDLTPGQRDDLLRRIETNADRLGAMVASLLDTSAMESGQFVVSPQSVELRTLLEPAVERFVSLSSAHPVRLDVPPGVVVEADPRLLEHVIENLLANVAKHTPAGTNVTVSGVVAGDRARIAVQDEGPGIGADDLPHVFERFYRGGEPDRRTSSGLGLGLALANEVVRLHGSQLDLRSEPGVGTTFSFEVPVASAGQAEPPRPSPAEWPPAEPRPDRDG